MTPEEKEDWKRGRESNIPDCCIRFYTTLWNNPIFQEQYRTKQNAVGIISYIVCPACLKARRFNSLKLDRGGYHIPLVLGWRYRRKDTGQIWVMTGMDYRNYTIWWIGMTPENDLHTEYHFGWDPVQDEFELADKPLTF